MQIQRLLTTNFEDRETPKKLIVIHWTVGSFSSAIDHFMNPASKVSAHYLISVTGTIVQMVEEKYIAWHCNPSNTRNLKTYYPVVYMGLNYLSIGIELEGPPSYRNLSGWQDIQIETCAELCRDIETRNAGILLTDHSTIDNGLGKIDVKKATGIDVFPWEKLLTLSGIPDAAMYPV
jgi:N-acetylmuramoyl-L-alanine amidase